MFTQSAIDQQTLTLFLQDSYYGDWFTKPSDARYGFMAIADRYQKFDCDFYLASYYHFSCLVGRDYETAVAALSQKLGELDTAPEKLQESQPLAKPEA